jgi:DNA-binding CsgD family transcriptional regulator
VERLLGRHDASRRRLERALLRGGLADEVTIALAVSAFERGDYAEVADRAAAVRHAADPLVRACATALLAVVLRFAGDTSASEAEATAALAAVRTATDRDFSTHAELTMATSWALLAVERFDDALSVGRLGSQAARSAGNLAGEVPLLLAEVLALGLLGRTAEAADAVDRAELAARMSHSDQSMQWALWMRAWVLLDRDELDGALRCAQESVDLAETLDDSALVVIGRAVLGSVLLAVGRAAEAVPLLAAYDVDPGWTCRWAPRLVEAQLAVGDREAAEATASRATRLSAASGLAGPLAGAALARSMLAVEVEALREAESAIRHASSIGADLDRAQGHLLAGRATVTTDREAALAHLESARELAFTGGARRAEAAATFELRRLGRRVGRGGSRASGAAGVASLSGREREVADLVARGLTNRQIAAHLFLSEKTIEAHLSRAFAKLGVSGRAALAAAVSAPPATDG